MSRYYKIILFLGFAYVFLILGGKEEISWYLKPFFMPCLILASSEHQFSSRQNLLFALFFSWIGDLFLMFVKNGQMYFISGLIAYLIAHLGYIRLFFVQNKISSLKTAWFLMGCVGVGMYLMCMLSILLPTLGGLKIPVIIYATVLSIMLISAYRGFYLWKEPYNLLVLIGAVIFVISDSILAINKFHTALPYAPLLIMGTYIPAQFFISYGIIKLNREV